MIIRVGTAGDVEQIAALHTDSWQGAYAHLMPPGYLGGPLRAEHLCLWRDRFATGRADGHLLVADNVGAVAGFAYAVPQPDGRVLLDNLHVRPTAKGTGIGRHLLRRMFAWTAAEHPGSTLYLEVLRDNTAALAFYRRHGGAVTNEHTESFPGFTLPALEYGWTAAEIAAAPAD